MDQIFYFRHHFPHDWSRPEYQTQDKIIPFKLFNMMMIGAKANRAMEKLTITDATMIGYASANSNSGELERIRNDFERQAKGHT